MFLLIRSLFYISKFKKNIEWFIYTFWEEGPETGHILSWWPENNMELNYSVEMRMAKGACSIRLLFGEFL